MIKAYNNWSRGLNSFLKSILIGIEIIICITLLVLVSYWGARILVHLTSDIPWKETGIYKEHILVQLLMTSFAGTMIGIILTIIYMIIEGTIIDPLIAKYRESYPKKPKKKKPIDFKEEYKKRILR